MMSEQEASPQQPLNTPTPVLLSNNFVPGEDKPPEYPSVSNVSPLFGQDNIPLYHYGSLTFSPQNLLIPQFAPHNPPPVRPPIPKKTRAPRKQSANAQGGPKKSTPRRSKAKTPPVRNADDVMGQSSFTSTLSNVQLRPVHTYYPNKAQELQMYQSLMTPNSATQPNFVEVTSLPYDPVFMRIPVQSQQQLNIDDISTSFDSLQSSVNVTDPNSQAQQLIDMNSTVFANIQSQDSNITQSVQPKAGNLTVNVLTYGTNHSSVPLINRPTGTPESSTQFGANYFLDNSIKDEYDFDSSAVDPINDYANLTKTPVPHRANDGRRKQRMNIRRDISPSERTVLYRKVPVGNLSSLNPELLHLQYANDFKPPLLGNFNANLNHTTSADVSPKDNLSTLSAAASSEMSKLYPPTGEKETPKVSAPPKSSKKSKLKSEPDKEKKGKRKYGKQTASKAQDVFKVPGPNRIPKTKKTNGRAMKVKAKPTCTVTSANERPATPLPFLENVDGTSPEIAPKKTKSNRSANSTRKSKEGKVSKGPISPEKANLSIPEISKSAKRLTTITGRYDRRKHILVTSDEDRTMCKYRDMYVCTDRILSPNREYCEKHLRIMKKGERKQARKRKSIPRCCFVLKSNDTQLRCTIPSVAESFKSKYCEGHSDEILQMMEKLSTYVPNFTHADVMRNGISADFQKKSETSDHSKSEFIGESKRESDSQLNRAQSDQSKVNDCNKVSSECNGMRKSDTSSKTKSENNIGSSCLPILPEGYTLPPTMPFANLLNNFEDELAQYKNSSHKYFEYMQHVQSDSDECDDVDELRPDEMTSTAGFHSTEELTELLQSKFDRLNEFYRMQREYDKKIYKFRRILYLESEEQRKNANGKREVSNPNVLPCNEQFPHAFHMNECLERDDLRYKLKHSRLPKNDYGLLLHKLYENHEKAAKESENAGHLDNYFTDFQDSKSNSPGPSKRGCKPTSSRLASLNSPGTSTNKQMSKSKSISSLEKKVTKSKKLVDASLNGKDVQNEDVSETVVTSESTECAANCCSEKPLPLTRFCPDHVTKDDLQLLYIPCGSLKTTSTPCDTPVMDLMEMKGCPIHFQEWLPDLPLSKEEKDHLKQEEEKQMILPNAEDEVIDSILISQFADLSHLEEELAAAIHSDYLDTDSESEESADDEKRLPPLSKGVAIGNEEESEDDEDRVSAASDESISNGEQDCT